MYHKYDEDEIRSVCSLLENCPDMTYEKMSELTGVSMATISYIATGRTWRDVSRGYKFAKRKTAYGGRNPNVRYDTRAIEYVCMLLNDKYLGLNEYTTKQISKMTGVGISTISKIKSGEQWRGISERFDFMKGGMYYNAMGGQDVQDFCV